MECQIDVNKSKCTCSYESCERRGRCCDCISHHRSHGQLPGCLFPQEIEKTYDRSIERFVATYSNRRRSG